MGQTKKTDNDFLRDKLDLRIAHMPEGDVSVLDCYSGHGVIWRTVRQMTGRPIKVLPIDVRDDIDFFHLHGPNQDFLATLDLAKYNVIDLDAYGVPFEQLKTVFQKQYSGTVFVTFIQSLYGQMPKAMLSELGFVPAMVERTPTLFARRGWDYFKQWLAMHGVKRIHHRSISRKHYLAFRLDGTEQLYDANARTAKAAA
jgi:hypothetical protein